VVDSYSYVPKILDANAVAVDDSAFRGVSVVSEPSSL